MPDGQQERQIGEGFLFQANKPKTVIHIWDDGDTYCRRYSNGKLARSKYTLDYFPPTDGRHICGNCASVYEKYSGGHPAEDLISVHEFGARFVWKEPRRARK